MSHLRTVRFFQGKTQDEVAREAGLSQTAVSLAERGLLPDTPSGIRAKLKLADALGVPPDDVTAEPKS